MIVRGDCLEEMAKLSADSVDAVVTDPPAGISFMGKAWDGDKGGREQWVAWFAEVAREMLRVMKPGAHGLVWALPRTSHWTATALEVAGFEVRDRVSHLFGTGFPKSLDVSKAIDKAAGIAESERPITGKNVSCRKEQTGPNGWENAARPEFKRGALTDDAKRWAGFGTALKPACEDWWLVQKKHTLASVYELCGRLCSEIATFAAESTQPTRRGFDADRESIAPSAAPTSRATEPANEILAGKAGDGRALTATLRLTSEDAQWLLSIASSWKEFLVESWGRASTSTTETASSLTIDLATLSCFLSLTTRALTAGGETSENTLRESVQRAALLFDAFAVKLDACAGLSATGLAGPLAPNAEDAWLIRKPLSEKTVAANILKWGTGALNIDASRIRTGSCEETPEHSNADSAASKSRHGEAATSRDFVPSDAEGSQVDDESTTRSASARHRATSAAHTGVTNACDTSTSSSTESYGSKPTGRSQQASSSTTGTKTKPTTGSKTSNSCAAPSTPGCTPDSQKNIPTAEAPRPIASAGAPSGRFPSHLVFSHNEDCREVGTRKVKGQNGGGMNRDEKSPTAYAFTERPKVQTVGFADADGTETVPAWECSDGCAVAELDAQSGNSKSTKLNCVQAARSPKAKGAERERERERVNAGFADSGGASRFFYCAKASRSDRGAENTHPTVKSTALMRYLIRLVTPPGGLVLDPFAGSGSTGVAAAREGFEFIGIERDETYAAIAEQRIATTSPVTSE